jgi:membrane associated rhomboid family serine protease
MIIPYGTDAPIYHRPYATIGLIVLNSAIFFALRGATEEDAGWMLDLGHGLHPVQWLTHNFLHADIGHLVGNMIFLWAYGIIVEGKLGALAYLLVYAIIGTLHGATVQLLCLGIEPTHALGASAVIFGLLTICLIWAPENRMSCFVFFWLWFRVYADTWEIPILGFAFLEVGWEVVALGLRGLTGQRLLSSAVLHLSGAVWGLIAGIIWLKAGWVDCENWDLFAVLAGREGRASKKPRKASKSLEAKIAAARRQPKPTDEHAASEERADSALGRVRQRIAIGDLDAARAAYDRAARTIPAWPPEADLLGIIKSMHEQKAMSESVPFMRDYCRLYPRNAARVRLKLAQILIRDQQRPVQALRVLAEVPEESLPTTLMPIRRQLVEQATRMQEEGVLELEGDD